MCEKPCPGLIGTEEKPVRIILCCGPEKTGMRIALPYPLEGWTFLKPAADVHPAAGILQVFLLLVVCLLYCNTRAIWHKYL
jgi:hypothetical protein